MKRYYLFFTIILLLFLFHPVIAQVEQWNNIVSGGKKFTALAEHNNNIWIGTDVGLIKLNKADGGTTFYDKSNGLPGHYITAIAVKNNGEVWFGLADSEIGKGLGLVKYDEKRFTYFSSTNSPLPFDFINTLCFDPNDNLWIGCGKSFDSWCLAKYDGYNWTTYNSSNSLLTSREIKSIAFENSKLWMATHGGLFSFDQSKWEKISGLPTQIINSVYVDNQSNKWVGMSGGVARLRDSLLTIFSGKDSTTPLYYNEVYSVMADRRGVLWAGTYKGLVKYDFTNWHLFTSTNSGLKANTIHTLLIDAEDNKWIGCFDNSARGRLVKYDNTNWNVYKTWKGNLSSNYVNFVEIQGQNIFIGSDQGLDIFDGTNWKSITWLDSSTYRSNFKFTASAVDNAGNVWFALRAETPIGSTPNEALVKYNGKGWVKYDKKNSSMTLNYIHKIKYSNYDKSLWLVTSFGIFKFDGSTLQQIEAPQNILPAFVINDIEVRHETKWFSSPYYGILAYDGSSWKSYDELNSSLPTNRVKDLYLDDKNNLWAVTELGLVEYDGSVWTVYERTSSLFSNYSVQSFFIDHNEVMYFGTSGDGLIESNGSEYKTYTKDNSPLLYNSVGVIKEDFKGNIWLPLYGTGISTYNRTRVTEIFDNKTHSMIPIDFVLYQNYPNPFNPTTTISYSIPVETWHPSRLGFDEADASSLQKVTLKIFDVLGREVVTLVNEHKQPGNYKVKFNVETCRGKSLPSGIYFYRLQAGSFSSTKKMILAK